MTGLKKITRRPYSTDTVKKSKTVAIIGSGGMLGSDLVAFLSESFQVTGIKRENYDRNIGKRFDIVINANGNSKRFWANEYPLEDFKLSTESVYRSVFDFSCGLYIYISSSDVYLRHDLPKFTREEQKINSARLSAYGFNKYLAEQIIKHYCPRYIILRSAMILGRHLKKGPFFDVQNKQKLYISRESRLQLITTQKIAGVIRQLLILKKNNAVYNLGGAGAFPMSKLTDYFSGVNFREDAETQVYDMNVRKLKKIYPLKTSEEYLQDYVKLLNMAENDSDGKV